MKSIFSINFKRSVLLFSLFLVLGNHSLSQTAPDFSFTDIHGQSHNLYDALNQGFIVLLDFFYTDCAPCYASAPEVQEIFEDYQGKNVLIFSLSDRDSNDQIEEFREILGLQYIQGGEEGGGKDVIHMYNDAFEMIGFPTISVICPDGTIDWDIFPYTTGAPEWRTQIDTCGVQDWIDYQPMAITSISLNDYPYAENDIDFYPNPTTDFANLNIAFEQETHLTISLFNSIGQFVETSFNGVVPEGNQKLNVPVHHLPTGTYHLKVQKDNQKIKNIIFIKI